MSHSSTHSKKVVVITSRFPYPLEKGDKLRAYYQIKELSKHVDVYLISLSEIPVREEDKQELTPYCKDIQIYSIGNISKWFHVLGAFIKNIPFQVAYFYNLSIHAKITTYLNQLKPDHIYCQLIRVSEYVKDYHSCPKTLDYMDALSKGIERRVKEEPFWKQPIFKSEFKRLAEYESSIFDYFEYHTIISNQDKEHIFHSKKNSIKVIPNGVDDYFFEQLELPKTYELVFTGNMSYPPNITASNYIVKELLPLLPPSTKVLLAGADPVKEVSQLANDKVTVSGWVEDIRTCYAAGKVFIAPMFIGTGLQNKLLEAMAMGVPCITTPLANNALRATPNEEILIASTSEEFVKHIEHLLTDSELYNKIATKAKNFIKTHYRWDTSTLQLVENFGV